jgi:phosphatidate cytidylyltransferase
MQRFVSGVVLGVGALAAVLYLPAVGLRVLACLVAFIAAGEYLRLLDPRPGGRAGWLALVTVTAWVMAAPTVAAVAALLTFTILAGAVSEVIAGKLPVARAMRVALAPWYIGLPLGLLAAVHGLGGPSVTLLLLATVIVSDTSQYYTGRAFGRRLLAQVTSPRKTVEGALGGVVCSAVFLTIVGGWAMPEVGRPSLAVVAVVIAVLGIGGDLFESSLKRAAGVKDSSTSILGHGGVLDRIDALLFATPAFYVYLRILT